MREQLRFWLDWWGIIYGMLREIGGVSDEKNLR